MANPSLDVVFLVSLVILLFQKTKTDLFPRFGGLEDLCLLPVLPIAGAEQRQVLHLKPQLSL